MGQRPGVTSSLKCRLGATLIKGHKDIFEHIFEKMQDKNPKAINGVTPFHFAASFGFLEICKLIICNVKDKNPKNNKGMTPLNNAACKGYFEICELIVSQVEDKNPRSKRDDP